MSTSRFCEPSGALLGFTLEANGAAWNVKFEAPDVSRGQPPCNLPFPSSGIRRQAASPIVPAKFASATAPVYEPERPKLFVVPPAKWYWYGADDQLSVASSHSHDTSVLRTLTPPAFHAHQITISTWSVCPEVQVPP